MSGDVFYSTLFPFAVIYLNTLEVALKASSGWVTSDVTLVKDWIDFPFFIGHFIFIGLGIFMLIKFKKRKKQLAIGKINYFVLLITIFLKPCTIISIF